MLCHTQVRSWRLVVELVVELTQAFATQSDLDQKLIATLCMVTIEPESHMRSHSRLYIPDQRERHVFNEVLQL